MKALLAAALIATLASAASGVGGVKKVHNYLLVK